MVSAATTRINHVNHVQDCIHLLAGETLFSQGDASDVLYVVKEGEIDLVHDGRLIETVGPGGIIGEVGVLDDGPRNVTAYARSDCRVVPISENRFMFLVHETPTFAFNVMRIMAERLRRMAENT